MTKRTINLVNFGLSINEGRLELWGTTEKGGEYVIRLDASYTDAACAVDTLTCFIAKKITTEKASHRGTLSWVTDSWRTVNEAVKAEDPTAGADEPEQPAEPPRDDVGELRECVRELAGIVATIANDAQVILKEDSDEMSECADEADKIVRRLNRLAAPGQGGAT